MRGACTHFSYLSTHILCLSLLAITLALIPILISYNASTGMVTIIWLATSGGVIMAAIIRIPIYACLRYFLRNSGVIKPKRDKIETTTGNSKNNPVKNVVVVTMDIYDVMVKLFEIPGAS